jgi:hypothetical protein
MRRSPRKKSVQPIFLDQSKNIFPTASLEKVLPLKDWTKEAIELLQGLLFNLLLKLLKAIKLYCPPSTLATFCIIDALPYTRLPESIQKPLEDKIRSVDTKLITSVFRKRVQTYLTDIAKIDFIENIDEFIYLFIRVGKIIVESAPPKKRYKLKWNDIWTFWRENPNEVVRELFI